MVTVHCRGAMLVIQNYTIMSDSFHFILTDNVFDYNLLFAFHFILSDNVFVYYMQQLRFAFHFILSDKVFVYNVQQLRFVYLQLFQ